MLIFVMPASPSLAVIVLNWRRPQNIARIVRTAAEALPHACILVLDQAEEPNNLAGREDIPWHLMWHQTRQNKGPGERFKLAADLPFDYYLCIDDDVFLTIAQMQRLMDQLIKEPGRAHGVWGQLLMSNAEGNHHLFNGIARRNTEVSILNQVYAFTKSQALEAITLASLAGFESWSEARFCDDLLLSCSGEAPARIYDFGQLERCSTSDTPGVAVWKQIGFHERRLELAAKMLRLGRLHVQSGSRPA